MPQRRTAIKDLRRNRRHHLHNLDIKTDLRKTIKNFLALITAKNVAEARSALKLVYKKLDKAAKRHVLHDNTASRRKARFSKLVQTISA
ncbi:MAG: 30S ribosomal protein S20 [Candidatus Omnitrophica bacterium]|nr:30S ribosomal protein S20 [Candidatus Omnitrophota bacterium]MBI5023683.1 30S ribosomal protein S20 [Candidatus Omnitrophota bacterium]